MKPTVVSLEIDLDREIGQWRWSYSRVYKSFVKIENEGFATSRVSDSLDDGDLVPKQRRGKRRHWSICRCVHELATLAILGLGVLAFTRSEEKDLQRVSLAQGYADEGNLPTHLYKGKEEYCISAKLLQKEVHWSREPYRCDTWSAL